MREWEKEEEGQTEVSRPGGREKGRKGGRERSKRDGNSTTIVCSHQGQTQCMNNHISLIKQA